MTFYVQVGHSHAKKNRNVFTMILSPGKNWHPTKAYREQKYVGAHIQNIKKLYQADHIVLALISKDRKTQTIIFKNFKSIDSLILKIKNNPFIHNKVMKYKISDDIILMKEKNDHH